MSATRKRRYAQPSSTSSNAVSLKITSAVTAGGISKRQFVMHCLLRIALPSLLLSRRDVCKRRATCTPGLETKDSL